jgi:putative ABC transport system permease protein
MRGLSTLQGLLPEPVRNIMRRRLRTSLTVLGITIGIFVLVVLGAMAERVNVLVQGGEQFLKGRIAITEAGAHPFVSSGLISDSLADRVRGLEGVACVERDISMLLDPDDAFSFGMPRTISGIDVSERQTCEREAPGRAFKLNFTSGGWWQPGETGKTVLGVDVARHFNARVGDTVFMRDHPFQVVGVLERTLTGPDNIAFVSLEDARTLLADERPIFREIDLSDKVMNIYVIPREDVDPDALAATIRDRNPDMGVLSPSELIGPLETSAQVFNFIILGVAMVALIVGGLSIINTMVMSVAERVREIGIKKAVGASDWDVLKEYLSEAAVIGLLGGAIGLALGAAAVAVLNDLATQQTGASLFLITARLAVGSLAFATGLGAAAGLLPAIRAARLRPVEALREE